MTEQVTVYDRRNKTRYAGELYKKEFDLGDPDCFDKLVEAINNIHLSVNVSNVYANGIREIVEKLLALS